MLDTSRAKGFWFNAGVIIVFTITIFSNILVNISLQNSINNNQKDTLAARQANIDRQNDLKGYIKCILLIGFDHPELKNNPSVTKDQVSKALDDCASKRID